jgi:hypothetical protein
MKFKENEKFPRKKILRHPCPKKSAHFSYAWQRCSPTILVLNQIKIENSIKLIAFHFKLAQTCWIIFLLLFVKIVYKHTIQPHTHHQPPPLTTSQRENPIFQFSDGMQ